MLRICNAKTCYLTGKKLKYKIDFRDFSRSITNKVSIAAAAALAI